MLILFKVWLFRSIVVHAGVDDLGQGGTQESLSTGSAGARLDCCVIKWQEVVARTAAGAGAAVGSIVATMANIALLLIVT